MDSEELISKKNKVIKPHIKKGFFIAVCAVFLVLLTYTTIKTFSSPSLEKILENQEKITEKITEMQSDIAKLSLLQSSSELNTKQIKKLKEEITDIRNEDNYNKDILGIFDLSATITATPIPIANGFLTIKTKWKTIDVNQEKNSNSKIVGQAMLGKTYEYSKKEGYYYYIILSPNTKGWIHEQFVTETSQ